MDGSNFTFKRWQEFKPYLKCKYGGGFHDGEYFIGFRVIKNGEVREDLKEPPKPDFFSFHHLCFSNPTEFIKVIKITLRVEFWITILVTQWGYLRIG